MMEAPKRIKITHQDQCGFNPNIGFVIGAAHPSGSDVSVVETQYVREDIADGLLEALRTMAETLQIRNQFGSPEAITPLERGQLATAIKAIAKAEEP